VTGFPGRYGPWALVAGASEGIGAAFATALARRGLDLVLVARRPGPLAALAGRLPVRAITVAADLATARGLAAVKKATQDLEVGLVVVNAAYSPIGRLIDQDPAQTQRALDLNCRAPLVLAHRHLPAMAARGRGGLIIMSSLAGLQGTPSLATYAATKAFGGVLAEGLWAELRGTGWTCWPVWPGQWPPLGWTPPWAAGLPAPCRRSASPKPPCGPLAAAPGPCPVP
jgi:uncharacterized protein